MKGFYKQGAKFLLLMLGVSVGMLQQQVAHAQLFDWAKNMGADQGDHGYGVAADVNGNVYVTGYFSGTANFNATGNGGRLANAGGLDAFLAKYDAAGNFIWAKSMGGSKSEYGQKVAVDKNGNVFVTGYFNSETAEFNYGGAGGTVTNAGEYDVFLAKYDTDGKYLWVKSMGGKGWDQGQDLAVDDSGNVIITGSFYDTAYFDGADGGRLTTASPRNTDVFLAKYDTDGNFIWAKGMGGSSSDYGFGVTADVNGNIYVTGVINSATAEFNPGGTGGVLTQIDTWGGADVFLVKYDATGSFLWGKCMGGDGDDYGYGVAVDKEGNVCITGYFTASTAEFNSGGNGGALFNNGMYSADIFLARYDSSGNFAWAKAIGSGNYDRDWGTSVAMDASSNVYITGYFSGKADFNPGGLADTLVCAGNEDVFFAKYNKDGDYYWAKRMGGTNSDQGYGVALDPNGNAYVAGMFYSDTADFNPSGAGGELRSFGYFDVFLARFGCSDTVSNNLTVSSCEEVYSFNDNAFTESGVYSFVFPSASGCDSTVTLDLTIAPIEKPLISVSESTLSTQDNYATYQWFLDGEAIIGATKNTHSVTANGDYTVVVTSSLGCEDTSDKYTVNNSTNIGNVSLAEQIKVYPNPTVDVVNISAPQSVDVVLTDVAGKVISNIKSARQISLSALPDGVYFLKIQSASGELIKQEKVVKVK